MVGIDLDAVAVELARRHFGDPRVEYTTGTVLELPLQDRSFDVVLCMEAIEHFSTSDGVRYITELRRVCRPGGFLVGSTSLPETRAAADRICARNPHHLHVYTSCEMAGLLRERFGGPTWLTPHYFVARAAPA